MIALEKEPLSLQTLQNTLICVRSLLFYPGEYESFHNDWVFVAEKFKLRKKNC